MTTLLMYSEFRTDQTEINKPISFPRQFRIVLSTVI